MSSEVCPFCGKTYKRLKSHLPHCKVAASSKSGPTKHDVAASQTTSSSQLAAVSSKTKEKGKKSTQTSTETTILQTGMGESRKPNTSSSLLASSSLRSTSLPPSTRKKKQKLADQIKAATLILSPSPPLSPIVSKPKKQSLRALIEAAKSNQVKNVTPEGENPPSDSTLSSTTKTKPDKDLLKDATSLSLLSADPKDAPKKKTLEPKKVKQSSSITKNTSDFLDSKLNKSSTRPRGRDFWVDSEEETEDLSVNKLLLKSKITLQDVKATLGRDNSSRQFSRPSILNQIKATANQKDAVSFLVTPVTPSDHQLSSSSQHTELKPAKKKASKSNQPALITLKDNAPSHPEPTSLTATPLLSAQTLPSPRSASLSEGLKVGHHNTGLFTVSPPLSQFSSPLHFPHAPQTLPVGVDRVEKLQLDIRKQNTAQHPTEGVLTQRSLGQVTLRDLPEWMACKTPSHPREMVEMVQRGWQWYYRKYIDVKKGGVAGLGMLLAGYCVISYFWSYPHIKLDRWRKYH